MSGEEKVDHYITGDNLVASTENPTFDKNVEATLAIPAYLKQESKEDKTSKADSKDISNGQLNGFEKTQKNGKFSASMITNLHEERKRVYLVTFATMSAAASYILMLFIAMPLSIHTIINIEEGCEVEVDDACFAPIDRSQSQLTLTLTALRIATFLMGSFVGTLSDRFGRRPLLISALLGYTTAGVFFLIGWKTQNVNLFLAGAIALGASSPVIPHGIAYVSDVSTPNRLAVNLGILEGFGYFIGLMLGALISLGIGAVTTGVKEDLDAYNKLFYGSFAAGTILSLVSAIITFLFLPESLHPEDRAKTIDLKKANPFGFLPLVTRRMYFFLIWLSGMFAWCSIGSQESTAGGWWLRRYAISDTLVFIRYTVLLWVLSGIGAVICTKLYVSIGGLKFAIHISAIITILAGIAFAVAPTASLSYIAVGLGFFASAVLPTTLALLMGQVDSKEKGALAGAIRSSEALAKFIGIFVVGNAFAKYIEPFTPDSSCIPATYSSLNETNFCDCGVETCPEFIFSSAGSIIGTKVVPSECSLGQLSQKVNGKPSKFIDFIVNDPLEIYPQALIDLGVIERPDNCRGAGLEMKVGGLTTNLDRLWCVSEDAVNELYNQELGCPGFDFSRIQPDLAFISCENLLQPNETLGCTTSLFNIYTASGGTNYTVYHDLSKFSLYLTIFQRVLDPTYEDEICDDEFEAAEYNLCLGGPIASFPGLFPLMFMGLLGALGYLTFVIAEIFFIKGDQRYWVNREEELANEETLDTAIGA